VVVVPDARHALPLEKPHEFNVALAKFLSGLSRDVDHALTHAVI
jgi:hypothetical protein